MIVHEEVVQINSIDNIRSCLFVCLMVFNATFNNISVISWRPVLLMEETRGPGENHWPVASQWQTVSHMFYQVHLAWARFELTTLVVKGTICIEIVNPTTIWSRPRRPHILGNKILHKLNTYLHPLYTC